MNKHEQYMQRAFTLALKGQGTTLPNPMVGAVLVKAGKVIAEGWHVRCGADHAEAMAISKAGVKAKGCELYVTLEPCSHTGRTPPCTEAIIKAGIRQVYVGVLDPNSKMNGKSVALLRKAGIVVEVGFLQDELTQMNEAFNKYITTGMPWVVAKTAQTLDGKVATLKGESKWITSDATREFSRQLRSRYNGIVVGINTVLADDPCLIVGDNNLSFPKALVGNPIKNIKKIIIDSKLRISLKARLFKETTPQDVIVVTTAQASVTKLRSLKKQAQVLVAPAKGGQVDLHWAFKALAKQEIAAILLEGGPTLIGSALKASLVDKMHIYIAPQIMGEGLPSIRGLKVNSLAQTVKLKDVSLGTIGNDVFIEGYI